MNPQEVDNSIGTTSGHWNIGHISNLRNETLGGKFRLAYVSNDARRIIEPTLKALSETKNPGVSKEAHGLISTIIEIILELNKSKYDTSNLAPLVSANLEDGSFLIEWLSTNYRIGFVIEVDPKESIWYLVARSGSSDTNLSGSLVDNKKELLTQLVSYMAVNS